MALILTNHSLFSKDKFFPLRGFFYAQPDMPPHKQEFTEVIFILKGKVLHYSDPAGWEESAAGDVWLIPPGGIHGYLKAENLQIFNLLFIADQLPVPLLELYRHPGYKKLFSRDNSFWENAGYYPRLRLDPRQQKDFTALLNLFVRQQKSKTPGRIGGKYGLFMAIISMLCDIAVKDNEMFRQEQPLDMSRISSFLNENYAANINLSDLTHLTSMSESSLRRHFRKTFGCAPAGYIRKFRLEVAAKLLLNTNFPVKEIAQMSGFNTVSYFCKIFRQVYKRSPQNYRFWINTR